MKGKINFNSRSQLIESLSLLLYYAMANDSHSMLSCFFDIVDRLCSDIEFLTPESESESCSDDSEVF